MSGGRLFYNRAHELQRLQRRWDSGEAQIFTLWGRRRVGKSLLLLQFAQGKRHLYFEATSGTAADQLADFSVRLAEATARAALSASSWRDALDAVADWAAEGPVLVVLDEFQQIASESSEIGSIINVWWREQGADLPIFLVLCGSEVGFFEREVVGYSASTYGRRAGHLRLRPFAPKDVALFLEDWTAEEQIAAYAVFGNMPYYLAQIRPDESLAENILNLILMSDGLLHEEARLLLEQELTDAAGYFSVLRAIAAGQTRVSQIAVRTGVRGGTTRVSQMLDTLRDLWLVERVRAGGARCARCAAWICATSTASSTWWQSTMRAGRSRWAPAGGRPARCPTPRRSSSTRSPHTSYPTRTLHPSTSSPAQALTSD